MSESRNYHGVEEKWTLTGMTSLGRPVEGLREILSDAILEPYRKLELEFGRWAGMENMVACSSGTAALHLALESLRLTPGSKVAVPCYSMIACARAVTLAGLEPVFVDCRRSDLTMDPEHLADVLENSPAHELNPYRDSWKDDSIRAVMPVHVYGRSCDMPAIVDLAMKHELFIVEDLAEAHGLSPHPNTHAACWSFYKNKVIAGEEGGAVAFKEGVTRDRARQLRNVGFTDAHDYTHVPRGHNYRLANILAEPIRESLRNYDDNMLSRRQIENRYDDACPPEWKQPERYIPWVYDLRIPGLRKEQQRTVVERLRRFDIAARYGFQPMHGQKEYQGTTLQIVDKDNLWFPQSVKASREVIYLPLTPDMTAERISTAFDLIKRTLVNPSWSE